MKEELVQPTTSNTRHRNIPSHTDLAPHKPSGNGTRNNTRSDLDSPRAVYNKIYPQDDVPALNLLPRPNDNTGPEVATTREGEEEEEDEAGGEDDDDGNDSMLLDETEKRIRQDGKAFEKQRKISHELDTVDKIIVNLKRQNYPNDQIAEELRKLGLSNYDPKTVGSRFIRVEKKIEDHEAQRIEDGLTDWHDGEVCTYIGTPLASANKLQGRYAYSCR
jgi:hypothetical protein